jgi:hypothetical protein
MHKKAGPKRDCTALPGEALPRHSAGGLECPVEASRRFGREASRCWSGLLLLFLTRLDHTTRSGARPACRRTCLPASGCDRLRRVCPSLAAELSPGAAALAVAEEHPSVVGGQL